MALEHFIRILIILHASFGTMALTGGTVALFAVKGSSLHKRAGKIFYYTMILSALVALIISAMPLHHSVFLFNIGLFSLYFILSGYRALRFQFTIDSLNKDKFLSTLMILTGVSMVICSYILTLKLNMVLLVFGVFAIIFGIRDLQIYKNKDRLRLQWKQQHIGKMTGGYISAITAFVVVNQVIPGIWGWFVPSILGGYYIFYWIKKVNRETNTIL